MHRLHASFVGLLVAAQVSACAAPQQTSGPQAAAITAARVSNHGSPYRPRLTLVERDGDPLRGVALAVYVPASASAALALSVLVEARMRDAGFVSVSMHPSASGFIMHALVGSLDDMRRFVQAANSALTRPVTAAETERVAIRWRAAPPRQTSVASEAAVARCSGELVLGPDAEAAATLPARLAPWLASVRAGDAAFAVVGPRDYLDAGAEALAEVPPWPRLGSTGGLSFGGELAGVRALATGEQNLSVALWGMPAAVAIASAERLGADDSLLSVRLAAGFPPWRVWRVASNLNRGGACLRVDMQASGAPPSLDALAASVSESIDELEYTLARVKPGPWVIAKQVLVMEGPDQAAAVAAWQAVTADAPSADQLPRRMVHYAGPLAESTNPERAAGGLAALPATPPPSVELRRALEPGQGQFWMLLATPCGTSSEDGSNAGALSLALHATALESDRALDVSLEPWSSADGLGIVAHAGPSAPYESAQAQAERVAEALARAVLRAGPSPEHIATARESLLETLPAGPAPGLSLALRQTTSNHPSYLDARGTWASLTAISARTAQLERQRFVRSKLRLASLGNHDEIQIQAAERRLTSLLRGVDAGHVECPARAAVASVPGKYVIDAPGVRDADAVVAIPLPPSAGGPSEEALWTEWLMNRPGGWLHQALQRPGLVSTARARALGGASAAALMIEVHAVDDKHEEAVAQVRGLLARLRAGAANADDVRSASDYLSQLTARRRLNPRGRLLDLWHGTRPARATLESLRALHRAAFETGREVVVMTRPAP